MSFTFFPKIAIAIGDEFDILFSNGSASVEPTILYSSTSSSSIYLISTVEPILTSELSPSFITVAFY